MDVSGDRLSSARSDESLAKKSHGNKFTSVSKLIPHMNASAPRYTVNARFRTQNLSGVQRYATEICNRLGGQISEIVPSRRCSQGMAAHAWEQSVLPLQSLNSVLWSPCNSGPLGARRHVVTIHDMSVFDYPADFSKKYRLWYQWLTPKLVRRSARVLTVSEFSRSRIIDLTGVHPEKVVVVPNGVADFFRAEESRFSNASDHIKGVMQSPYILAVGSLNPRKNLKNLIAAWNSIRSNSDLEDVKLLIAGGIETHVFNGKGIEDPDPSVCFLGRVSDSDLSLLYRRALVCVNPSFYEGFGLPIVESFATGCPVACSEISAFKEVAGDAALYFDPHSPDSLGQTLLQAIRTYRNPEDRLAAVDPLQKVSRKFNWNDSAKSVLEVLGQVASE